jgi:acyl carrier protein
MNTSLEVLGPLVAAVAHIDVASLSPETDLLATGLLDSLQVVHLAGEIERVFGLRLDAYDLTPENFASLAKLKALIQAKLLLPDPR